jgi:hypothetical protein
MKIRNGFVSNSSSSSFILISDKPLLTVEDVAECMTNIPKSADYFDADDPNTELANKMAAAQFVFDKIDKTRNTLPYLIQAVYSEKARWGDDSDTRMEKFKQAQKTVVDHLTSERHLTKINSIDDSGQWSELESGEYFIDAIHISEH